MRRLHNTLLLLSLAFACIAQGECEVWLFKLSRSRGGTYSVNSPVNVSRRVGYDNQPSFSRDSKMLYFVSHTEGQADIFTYNIRRREVKPFTRTSQGEYSPRLTPDNRFLSAVVVESDSAQRIHFLDPATGAFVRKLETDSVGYYHFLTSDTVVFYKLTSPHTLRWRTLQHEEEHFLGYSPARCFEPVSGRELVFGVKDSSRVDYYLYDMVLKKGSRLASRNPGSEDLVWHEGLGLLISEKGAIVRYNSTASGWEPLLDLSPFGIRRITRFSISPDGRYLAVVDNP